MFHWAANGLKGMGVPSSTLDSITNAVENVSNQLSEACAPISSPAHALTMAMSRKDVNQTIQLLQSGDPNTSYTTVVSSQTGAKPIHLATQYNLRPVVEYILQMDTNQAHQVSKRSEKSCKK